MRLKTKKMVLATGVILVAGIASIDAKALWYANISAGGYDCTAYGNGNINSSVFTYGGHKGGANYDAGKAYIKVYQKANKKVYCNQELKRRTFSNQKKTSSGDKKGLVLEVSAPGDNGGIVTASDTISCQ